MSEKDDDKLLGSAGSEGNLILFKLTSFKGHRMLDLRKYFKKKNSEELSPTRKGIALTQPGFDALCKLLKENYVEIEEWLVGDTLQDQVALDVRRAAEAQEVSRCQLGRFLVEEDEWRSPVFFRIEFEGSCTKLFLNKLHWMGALLLSRYQQTPEDELLNAFFELLVSFGKAKYLYQGSHSAETDVLLDGLMLNWGLIISRNQKKSPRA